ncbi:hypothetical protein [Noviherbaspirillum saxi]|uniref:Uncharacterized protein n=1 Tax=Noviherbaspirillum saxi TaxID=2320863 RepID=A0A3A3FK98_9BURK|nr:hypothetical protein [Noviherbaspirillum saxi]RJF95948.1 hypothetical protein D3871_21580 [Noviherbaspirillum saxi]
MSEPSFTRSMLRIFAGPIVWAVHFIVIYGFTGIACARRTAHLEWLGLGVIAWGIGGASIVAVATIAFMHLHTWRTGMQTSEKDFIRWSAAILGLISILAIAWETLPLFLVPKCE